MTIKADIPTTAAALAALLVAADGIIDPREVALAISLGKGMFTGFSPRVFETMLQGVTLLPPVEQLARVLRDLLDEDGKHVIMEYLVALAFADERVVDVEISKLEEVAACLGTELPAIPEV